MSSGQNKQIEILWLAPKWTFPVNDGAKVATDRLLGNLTKAGAIVDFACLGVPGEDVDLETPKKAWNAREAYYIKRNVPIGLQNKVLGHFFRLVAAPFIPLTMSSFRDKKILEFARGLAAKRKYDWIVLDGLHLGACFIYGQAFVKSGQGARFLYRAHNIEEDLWAGKAKSSSVFARPFFEFQRKLVAKIEKRVIENSDLVAAISKDDRDWIQKKFPKKGVALVNLGMNFSSPEPPKEKEDAKTFLFLGRLDWAPNKEGLRWFLRKVWPLLSRNGDQLVVAGSGDGSWLNEYSALPGLRLKGFVPDVDVLYRDCHAVIAPIFYGSGTRIKIIEAYAKGRVVVTTKLGAKGSGLKAGRDYFLAESKEAWINTLDNFDLDRGRVFAENGRQKLSKSFDQKDVALKLYKIMS